MNNSYRKDFLKIYLWKGLGIALNMVSMLIVVPALTSDPTIYGIYMLCMSLNIFLNYADIGFLDAGYKYAAEFYGKGDLKNEIQLIGFVSFILTLFLTIPFVFFIISSINPEILISGLKSESESRIASQLLLIQGAFTFSIVLNKINVITYGIRIKSHQINQITIITNLFKILSVFYFFNDNNYDIVGYFFLGKVLELVSYIIILYISKLRFSYDFFLLARSFRFSKLIFNQTKSLAVVSLVSSFMWIIYYELDSVVISKILGAETFAFFALGFTLTKFIRSFFSIIFGPFNARFNHFTGQGEFNRLNKYFIYSLKLIFPILFLFVLSIASFRESLILSWVGSKYIISQDVLLFLSLAMLLTPIRNLSVALSTALVKIKVMYLINIGVAISYWLIILLTINRFGVMSFAYSKFITFIIADLIYLYVICKIINIKFYELIRNLFTPLLIPVISIFVFSYIFHRYFDFYTIQNKMNLIFVIITIALVFLLSTIALYFTSIDFKNFTSKTLTSINFRKKVFSN